MLGTRLFVCLFVCFCHGCQAAAAVVIVAAGTSLSLVGSCHDNVESLQATGEMWPENDAAHPTKTDEFSPNR